MTNKKKQWLNCALAHGVTEEHRQTKQTMASRILFGRSPSNSYIQYSNIDKQLRWECLCEEERCMSKELTRTIIIRVYTHNLTLGRHAAHCCLMSHNIQRNPSLGFIYWSVSLFRTACAERDWHSAQQHEYTALLGYRLTNRSICSVLRYRWNTHISLSLPPSAALLVP